MCAAHTELRILWRFVSCFVVYAISGIRGGSHPFQVGPSQVHMTVDAAASATARRDSADLIVPRASGGAV